jgi:hypothetical protein
MFCAPAVIFDVTEGVGSSFPILLSRTRFRRYRGRRVPFSCFSRSDSFTVLTRASGPVFIFCAPGQVFGGSDGVVSLFLFCAPGLVLGGTEGVNPIFMFCPPRLVFGGAGAEGVGVPFSCFALPNSFSAVPRSSGAVFWFCAPALFFGVTEGVGSGFHDLRCRARFRRYRGRLVPFTCNELPNSFSAVPRASGPVFMFCVPGRVLGGT